MALAHRGDLKAEIDMIVERARKGCEVLVRLGFAEGCEGGVPDITREASIAIMYYSIFVAAKNMSSPDNLMEIFESIHAGIYLLALDSGREISDGDALDAAASFILRTAGAYIDSGRDPGEPFKIMAKMARLVREGFIPIFAFSDDKPSIEGANLADKIIGRDINRFVGELANAIRRRRFAFMEAASRGRYIDALKIVVSEAVRSMVGRGGEDVDVTIQYITYSLAAMLRTEKRLEDFILSLIVMTEDEVPPPAAG